MLENRGRPGRDAARTARYAPKVAREVGVSGVLLAAAMGHESEATTTEHYAGRNTGQQDAIEQVTARVTLVPARIQLFPLCIR
jgi:hypothetical protein